MSEKEQESFNLLREAGRLFYVGVPSVAVQITLYLIYPQSASVVGRLLGSTELGAFSLGNLTGYMSCLSIMIGGLSAADTLMPRAYGSENYEELGRLVVRSFVACSLLLVVPVIFLSQPKALVWILTSLGQDPEISRLAASWVQFFLLGVPANLIFRVLQRFLVAQHQPWPPVYASILPCFVFHPLLLKCLVPAMGLNGAAFAISITQWLMLLILILYLWLQPICEPATVPKLSLDYIRKSLRCRSLVKFLRLSIGGVFSLSEWWFWETMCFVAGTFGVVSLCAHTIAYNIIPLSFMIPLGLGIGLSNRIGHVITRDASDARRIAWWTLLLSAIIGAMVGTTVYILEKPIVLLFTNDVEVINETHHIWGCMCYYLFIYNIYGVNGAILRSLGLQWRMAAILILLLWFCALPTVLWFAVHKGGGLYTQWRIVPIFYTVLQGVLIYAFDSVDWKVLGTRKSLRMSGSSAMMVMMPPLKDDLPPDESTSLLPLSDRAPTLYV